MQTLEEELRDAIRNNRIVRLGYSRLRDGMLSLHFVAPVDLRPGETPATVATIYLWAYCFDESLLETHLFTRIRSVTVTDQVFDPEEVMGMWPDHKWPRPADWVVARDW